MIIVCEYDGIRFYGLREGAGSVIQYILSAFCFAQENGYKFAYLPSYNIGHFEHHQILPDEWDKSWNKYIYDNMIFDFSDLSGSDLPKKIITDLSSVESMKDLDVIVDLSDIRSKLIYTHPPCLMACLDKLRLKYAQNNLPCYFDQSKCNVAFHIRQFTSTDGTNPDSSRDYFNMYQEQISSFQSMMKWVKSQRQNVVFHIYSQGHPEKFKDFGDVILHLEEHPIISLHHMIKADILFMAASSFSEIAATYSQGIKIIKPGFRRVTSDIIYFDPSTSI